MGETTITTKGKFWDGNGQAYHKEIPGNFKMSGAGEVKVDFSQYGIDVTGSVAFDGSVSSKLV